jgi:hypothetical protein
MLKTDPLTTGGPHKAIKALKLSTTDSKIPTHTSASTIFHEPWWLEIACDGHYREAVVTSDGKAIGRLPYACVSKFSRLTLIGMPNLTHVLGPSFAPQYANPDLRSLKQLAITRQLIAQLPRAIHTSFRLHAGIHDTLAFNEAGFQTSVNFTVVIPPAPADTIWRQMRDKTRNVIRRAQERHTVGELEDPAQFLDLYEGNLKERGIHNNYDARLCLPLIAGAVQRGVGRMTVARDPMGTEQGAVFTIWDEKAAYYLMSTRAKAAMNGVVNLLIWDAIQHAAAKGLSFDMDMLHVKRGSLPNHLLLTGFGGMLAPRFVVSRTSPMVRVAREIRNAFAR